MAYLQGREDKVRRRITPKISEVAKAAGISMGLMYHYFSSKEQLFSYLVEETTRLSNEGLLYLENLPLPPRQKIMALAQMVVEVLSQMLLK